MPFASTSTALIPTAVSTLSTSIATQPIDPSTSDPSSWQVVLVNSSQRKLVLYDKKRNALHVASTHQWIGEEVLLDDDEEIVEIINDGGIDAQEHSIDGRTTPTRRHSSTSSEEGLICPLCRRGWGSNSTGTWAEDKRRGVRSSASTIGVGSSTSGAHHGHHRRSSRRATTTGPPIFDLVHPTQRIKDSHYFALLSRANSRNNSPRTTASSFSPNEIPPAEGFTAAAGEGLASSTLNTGYFESFFETLQLLGRGGAGSVWLVRHVLNGEALGLYACKKVAVGDSAPSLLRILREVHLLEAVHHPNIVIYHHAWVENSQLSAYAPSVPTLHILMAYANGGSLASFIDRRRGSSPSPEDGTEDTPAQRKERHRLRKLGAVHLLRIDEIVQLSRDVTMGLGFLHQKNILHLDLKAENVLLHWDEEALLPIAKLSDFGNATSEAYNRERIGGSGTLMYTAPESFDFDTRTGKLHVPDRATDQWALGLIVHFLCFFTLPYHNEDDAKRLEQEIKSYPGFFPSDASSLDHGTRHDLPVSLLRLIGRLVNRIPTERPSCEKVLLALEMIFRGETTPVSSEDEVVGEDGQDGMRLVRSSSPGIKRFTGLVRRRLLSTTPEVELLPISPNSNQGEVARVVSADGNAALSAKEKLRCVGAGFVLFQLLVLGACRRQVPRDFTFVGVSFMVVSAMLQVLVPRWGLWCWLSILHLSRWYWTVRNDETPHSIV